jgi:hypothetical protein
MKKVLFAVLFATLAAVSSFGHAAPITFGTFAGGSVVTNGIIRFEYASHTGFETSSSTTNVGLNNVAPVDGQEAGDDTIGYISTLGIGNSAAINASEHIGRVDSTISAVRGTIGVLVSIDNSILNYANYGITSFDVAQSGPAGMVTVPTAYYSFNSATGVYSDPVTVLNGTTEFETPVQSFYLLVDYSNGVARRFEMSIFTTYDAPPPAGVPEPTTLAVFGGIAALGFVAIRRRRQG